MNRFSWKHLFFVSIVFIGLVGWFQGWNSEKKLPVDAHEYELFTLLFGGDLMFDRSIRQSMEKRGSDFVLMPLRETLLSYDAVIANLEGPITTFPSKSVNSTFGSTNNYIFTFHPDIVSMLNDFNFSLVSLGNNHIRNFGVEGITQTKNFLREGGIGFFGNTGEESSSQERIYFMEKENKRLAFVGVNQFVANGFAVGEEDILFAREQSDIVIVLPHWGNEYWPESGDVIKKQAHRFIDLGADLIIGSHPHVVQQVEEYQGKKIYYSLGNFVFDQYFDEEVKKGLLVGLEIYPDGRMDFKEIPIQLKLNGQTTLLKE